MITAAARHFSVRIRTVVPLEDLSQRHTQITA
jgi:hypothetical protein